MPAVNEAKNSPSILDRRYNELLCRLKVLKAMKLSKGMVIWGLFVAVFISGCEQQDGAVELRSITSYSFTKHQSAWLRDHLPNETLAYINLPTPWNYLFDPKADAMHPVQSLAAHQNQVAAIKQGFKDQYFQYLPEQHRALATLLLAHMQSSLEVAVLNFSASAMFPSVAVATRLQGLTAQELVAVVEPALQGIDPSIILEAQQNASVWRFQMDRFPVFMQFDASTGRLLVYGGMGANAERLNTLWTEKTGDQLQDIKALSDASDPSGLNLKAWVAPAKVYAIGKPFMGAKNHQEMAQLGIDQMAYVWLGFESAKGQSALAMHVMMPETGWRLMLPRVNDWFDVTLASQPRSVVQLSLPTSEQVKQAIEHFKLTDKLSDKDRQDMAVFSELKQQLGFDFYDILDAYHQQFYVVKDQAGSWMAMKIKDQALHQRIDDKLAEVLDIHAASQQLAGVDIQHAHVSFYQKLFALRQDLPADAAKINQFLSIFKEHAYWYVEGDVVYMSSVPQILAEKKRSQHSLALSDWLASNQGETWDSAIFAYGKDVKHLPQDLYHFYLALMQGMGDLAQVEVDLFAFPTASELGLPDQGRMNLVLSSDAEKVSLKLGYEYSVLEGLLNSEGGLLAMYTVGVLAAYAIPAYRDYTVRAQLTNEFSHAASLKYALEDHWYEHQSFVGVSAGLELPAPNYSIDETTGIITVSLAGLYDEFEAGDEISFEPIVDGDYIEWLCYGTIKHSYLPQSCR